MNPTSPLPESGGGGSPRRRQRRHEYGNTTRIGDNEPPSNAGDVPVGGTVVEIATGMQHTCARLSTGAVRCWGDGTLGRLGYGNTTTLGDTSPASTGGDVPF